jgi:hypothetical protein
MKINSKIFFLMRVSLNRFQVYTKNVRFYNTIKVPIGMVKELREITQAPLGKCKQGIFCFYLIKSIGGKCKFLLF